MKIITTKKLNGRTSSLLLIAMFVFTFQSCVKDNFKFDKIAEVRIDPSIAAPVVYASLGIKDMLKNTGGDVSIITDTDGSLVLIYKSRIFSLDASQLVSLPNQTIPTFSIPVGLTIPKPKPAGTFTISNSQTVDFLSGGGVSGPLIDSMNMKAGDIFFAIHSDLHNDGSIVITIPGAKKDGVPFSHTINFDYTGNVPVIASNNYSLIGYKFDMTLGNTARNKFLIDYKVTINGSPTSASLSDKVDIIMQLNNLEFSKLCGDIGQIDLSVPADTIDLSLFTNAAGSASFTLADPRLKVIISNSFGAPIDAHLVNFQAYSPGTNTAPIPFIGFPDPLPILSPTLAQVGQTKVDSFKLDKNNSNLAAIINSTPKQLFYKLNAMTNPSGATSNNFILDTSHFDFDLGMELPLDGTAKNFLLVDTIPFSFNDNIPDQFESGLIKTYNSNGFPMDINLQVYFVDSLYNRLDSLITDGTVLIQSGIVNSSGRVIAPTATNYPVTIDKARMLKIKNAKNLVIKGVANTSNSGNTNVKIYSDYTLDFKLGIQLQLKLKK